MTELTNPVILFRNFPEIIGKTAMIRPRTLMTGATSGTHTRDLAGRTLTDLALGRARVPEGRVYARLKSGAMTIPAPCALAREDDATRKMWEDSAELTGWTA